MLSGLLHFVNAPHGRCGVEVPAETADYNQSIFCMWSPKMERMDSNQGSFSAYSNYTALEEGIESLLERNDEAEAEMTLYRLQEDIPVSSVENEREKLLRNGLQ